MLLPFQARNLTDYYKTGYNDGFLWYWTLETREDMGTGEAHCIL